MILARLAAGLAVLVVGAEALVHGASKIAVGAGLSPLVVGLTVVAFGTSALELAVSIGSSLSGQADLALGNVIGSNVFNLLAVLGFSAIAAPKGIAVPSGSLWFDVPVLIAVSVACLPILFSGHKIARWEGGLFLAYDGAYITYLVRAATQHDALSTFSFAICAFALPLPGITLVILGVRALEGPNSS